MAQAKARHKRRAAAQNELMRYAREHKLPRPSLETVNALLEPHDEKDAWSSETGTESAINEICGDYAAMASPVPPRAEGSGDEEGAVVSRTGAGFSHYIASVVRPYAEEFRRLVWGATAIPFTVPRDAAAWIEAQHKRECEQFGAGERKKLKAHFPNVEPASHTWEVCEGETLDKLRRLCERVHNRFEQWSEEQALAFILWGQYPHLSPRWNSRKGNGPGARTITITIPAPATEEEVLEAYRAALRAQGIPKTPKRLSQHQEALLGVCYATPGSWPKKLAKWKAYRAHYGEALRNYSAKEHGRRDMARDFTRASQRATWSGNATEERRDLGLYTLPILSPAEEQAERAKHHPNKPQAVTATPIDPAPWRIENAQRTPSVKQTYSPCSIDLERFTRLSADGPLGLSQEEARVITSHFAKGNNFDPDEYAKITHLDLRIGAIANGDVLRSQDR